MSASSTFNTKVTVTHVGTATAVLDIGGITFLTDPFFSPAGSDFPASAGFSLSVSADPALTMDQLPHIDAVLLSHENHPDNLDPLGRQLLDGRLVVTTNDGAKNLAPRPSVLGFADWQERTVRIAGKTFTITATPCKHFPGHECVGFIVRTDEFGVGPDGRPFAIYFSGDTVHVPELAQMADRYHIAVALMNVGKALIPGLTEQGITGNPSDVLQITMDGHQAAQVLRDVKADLLVPMHYENWNHFSQQEEELAKEFTEEGVVDRVRWLKPGKPVQIV